MDLVSRFFGFRWVLLIMHGSSIPYVMRGFNPIDMAGYVVGRFEDGGDTIAPWTLRMRFTRNGKEFALTPSHFLPDGSNVSEHLIQQVSSIDPAWNKRKIYPLFQVNGTRKALPIRRGDYERKADRERYLREGEDPAEPSFETVCSAVFGTIR